MPDNPAPESPVSPTGGTNALLPTQRQLNQIQGAPQLHSGMRRQCVWRYHSMGWSVTEIAEKMQLGRQTVYRDLELVMEEAANRLKKCRDGTDVSSAILLHRLEDLFRRCQSDLQEQTLSPRQRVLLYEQTARILDRLAKFVPNAPDLNPQQPLQIMLSKIDNISPSVPIASPNPPCVPNS